MVVVHLVFPYTNLVIIGVGEYRYNLCTAMQRIFLLKIGGELFGVGIDEFLLSLDNHGVCSGVVLIHEPAIQLIVMWLNAA